MRYSLLFIVALSLSSCTSSRMIEHTSTVIIPEARDTSGVIDTAGAFSFHFIHTDTLNFVYDSAVTASTRKGIIDTLIKYRVRVVLHTMADTVRRVDTVSVSYPSKIQEALDIWDWIAYASLLAFSLPIGYILEDKITSIASFIGWIKGLFK